VERRGNLKHRETERVCLHHLGFVKGRGSEREEVREEREFLEVKF
jgi:hypothetical protein